MTTGMYGLICLSGAVFFLYLVWERVRADSDRRKLKHVIHVNGTRGKSATTRLIDAALREGGFRVFTKTTGTVPQIIGTDGTVRDLTRRGNANIKEQLRVLHLAAREGADVLCVECMALAPEYQYVSEHRMLRSDIGVITNVRKDHTEVMGQTVEEIAETLANTIPEHGVLYAGEGNCPGADVPDGELRDIDWPENVRMALAVAAELGIGHETALRGMRTRYVRDPYTFAVYRLPSGAFFVNALASNDTESVRMAFARAREQLSSFGRCILLLNTRADRAVRTAQMAELACSLPADETVLLGPGRHLLARQIREYYHKEARDGKLRQSVQNRTPVPPVLLPDADAFAKTALHTGDMVFAAGNLAGEGLVLLEEIRRTGREVKPDGTDKGGDGVVL